MADRILKLRDLNRATLARQMLLERETLTVPAAIERLVGLQAQLAVEEYPIRYGLSGQARRDTADIALTANGRTTNIGAVHIH